MTKDEVAAVLDEIGTLLELKGENSFRCQAYHNGARIIEQLEEDINDLVAEGRLGQVRGIGETLQQKIATLVTQNELPFLDELRASIPAGLVDMLRIPGLGPKKVKAIHDALGVTTIQELQVACEDNRVAGLKGFGAKSQQKIVEGLRFLSDTAGRVRFDLAYPLGEALLEQLSRLPGVIRSALCGSLRRRRETAKDIDILISADNPQPIMDAFVGLPEVLQVTGHGETKSSVVAGLTLHGQRIVLNADLRIVKDDQFPYALVHFTGNKDHNVRLREIAQAKGLKLNEYGLMGEKGNIPCKDEAEVYTALGLTWMPPEMREDTGEIEVSQKGTIPSLVEITDIQGVFHNHSTWSDGAASIEEMALAAKKLGLKYFGIGDHSQSLRMTNGLTPERVRQQHAEIDALNKTLKGIRILKGTECDILADGSLDYDDETLALFDYVVISVHTHFDMPAAEMTARICRALSHPAVTMLGHMTGRLLLRRDSYKLDIDEVLQTAAKHGKMIEINAQPSRLDLDWIHCKRAKSLGIPIVINPDAHSTGELAYFQYGVNVARRGWLTKEDIFNSQSLAQVTKEFERRKAI